MSCTKVLNRVDFQWMPNPFGLGHRQRSSTQHQFLSRATNFKTSCILDGVRMNPFEPPQNHPIHSVRALPAYAALTICVLLALIGIGTTGFGLFRILETTPAMGIPVDAMGNPLPVEGYPQLWLGLALAVISAILGILSLTFLLQKREDKFLSKLGTTDRIGSYDSIFRSENDNLNTTNNPMNPSGGEGVF